ncbi:MAG TPA: aerial mycelium formation protein [Acidimicrobiia bacterium]|nr:aerial mycelium formation protein [Acidimicrobiia bacterium]
MNGEHRRRIDQILEEGFLTGLESTDLDELRELRRMTDEVETELSYYRRLLHGRMDLLSFELRRRAGEETRSLIEALPEILGSGERTGPLGRVPAIFSPDLPEERHRPVDKVLGDDFLTRMPELSEDELTGMQELLAETEERISDQRRAVQKVFDDIQGEITRRYKDGVADSVDLLSD